MSYFPFIHMQVTWECWSWQRDGAGLSLHPSLLPTEPSPRHWFYWSSAGFSVPQCHPRSSVGFVVWGPIPQQLHPAGKDPQACFNIPLSHTEQELSASPAGGLSDHSWSSSPAPARCVSVWPAGGLSQGWGTPVERGPRCQDSPCTGPCSPPAAGTDWGVPHIQGDRGRNCWCQLRVPPALWVRSSLAEVPSGFSSFSLESCCPRSRDQPQHVAGQGTWRTFPSADGG